MDGSNNVIVTGASVRLNGTLDYATIKYSSAGMPLWTNRHGSSSGNSQPIAVAVDASNNVIVTGVSYGVSTIDYATIQYSSAGVPLWTNRYNGAGIGSHYATAVALDGNNNVIVTGNSCCSGNIFGCATLQYSSAGVPLWTNRYDWPQNQYRVNYAVAVDGSNNVIVAGYSFGSGGSYDFATIKYSAAGVQLWSNRNKGPSPWPGFNAPPCAMVLDRGGNVIVTGSSGTYPNHDYATFKYVFPLLITDIGLTNGGIQMLVDNFQPGAMVIEACTSLADWAPVFTNTTPTNVLFYTAPDASNTPTHFYRVSQFP